MLSEACSFCRPFSFCLLGLLLAVCLNNSCALMDDFCLGVSGLGLVEFPGLGLGSFWWCVECGFACSMHRSVVPA